MSIPSGQENNRRCGFGVDVLKGIDSKSNVDFPVPLLLHDNELDEEFGEDKKTPESSPYDPERLANDLSTKNASATWTSSTERGRRDLECINDDCCIIPSHLRHPF